MGSSVYVLRAAARLLGGTEALASALGIREALLVKLMSGRRRVPDTVVLRTLDILEDRRSRSASEINFQSPPERPLFRARPLRERPSTPIKSRNAHGGRAPRKST
jgi:hypothetical protein